MFGVTDTLKTQGFIDVEHYTLEGRERGSFVHDATVLDDADNLDDASVPVDWLGYIESYRRWREKNRPQWYLTETLVADHVLNYCGTLDRFGLIWGALWTIDFKTGAKERWHGLQLAAYEHAVRPPNATRSSKRGTLYLFDDGREAKLEPFTNRIDYDYFFAALACSNYREQYV